MILRIYRFMQSNPFPVKWLNEKVELFNSKNNNSTDFSESIWGKILLKDLQDDIIDGINSLKIVRNNLEKYFELDDYKNTIEQDIDLLKGLYDSINVSWDDAFLFSQNMKFKTWPTNKKIVIDLKDEAKLSRDNVKNKIMKKIKNVLVYDSNSAYNDIYEMYEILFTLTSCFLLG